ncbi:hypothetical protein NEH16_17910 [Streptomyces drozdowiczii]|uniref:Uncharacterized protein n=1 Tax=Streptomyces drozdowiczii TaxID=202862 RepID=A0ABY6PU56_9ACTN|nr:hypothetical protein [Streptomyces drozdowiczii]UZK55743.1 hypothetical protein NEH16_17910 [Streptomyces drozdowiczii]
MHTQLASSTQRLRARPQQETTKAGPKLASKRWASSSVHESQAIGISMLVSSA